VHHIPDEYISFPSINPQLESGLEASARDKVSDLKMEAMCIVPAEIPVICRCAHVPYDRVAPGDVRGLRPPQQFGLEEKDGQPVRIGGSAVKGSVTQLGADLFSCRHNV
jgi:hypothetical protein